MNRLCEAIKERGSMVIVPSSVVETMGLGDPLATASSGPRQAGVADSHSGGFEGTAVTEPRSQEAECGRILLR